MKLTAFTVGLSLAMVTAVPALAEDGFSLSNEVNPGPTDPIVMDRGDGCTLLTFEGLGDNEPIPPIAGDVTVTFGLSWLSIIDSDAGGSGNFANEPTPETASYYLDTSDLSINLSPGVQFIEFFYVASSSSIPVTLTAFDGADQVVDTAVGNTIGTDIDGAPCSGDPNGNFCLWDTITLNSATDNIVRIEITGSTANQIGFDNMQFCRAVEETGACCLPNGTCSITSAASCEASGGNFFPGQLCEDVNCDDPTPVETGTWGWIKSEYSKYE